MVQAHARRRSDELRARILAEPAVSSFITFLGEFRSAELPVVLEVIASSLSRPATPEPFQAAQIDPMAAPVQALESASAELSQLINEFPPEAFAPDEPPDRPPFQDNVQWNADGFISTVYGVPQSSFPPSVLAGVCGPGFGGFTCEELAPTKGSEDELYLRWRRVKRIRGRNREPTEEQKDSPKAALPRARGFDVPPEQPVQGELEAPETKRAESPVPEHHRQAPVTPPLPEAMRPTARSGTTEADPAGEQFVNVQVEEEPKAKRSRWSSPDRNPRFAFALAFTPPSNIPDKVLHNLTRLVSTIQQALRPLTFDSLDFVVAKVGSDPALYASIRDFQVVFSQVSLNTKLSLLSYGQRWSIAFESASVQHQVATVFLQVVEIPMRPAPTPVATRKPPSGPPSGGDRRRRGRTPPKGHDAPETKSRRVFDGGKKPHGARKRANSGPPAMCVRPPVVKHDPLADDPIQEFTPQLVLSSIDPAVGPCPSGPPTVPNVPLQPEPWSGAVAACCARETSPLGLDGHAMLDILQDDDDLHGPFENWSATQQILKYIEDCEANPNRPEPPAAGLCDSVANEEDKDNFRSPIPVMQRNPEEQPRSHELALSPTATWGSPAELPLVQGPPDGRVLSECVSKAQLYIVRDLPLASYGGFAGTMLCCPEAGCRVQFQGAVDCRAYTAACPRCFCKPCSCGHLDTRIRLPPRSREHTKPEVLAFNTYQHSVQDLLTREGLFTIHFTLTHYFGDGVWEFSFDDRAGILLIPHALDGWYTPAVGHQLALYQVPCVGCIVAPGSHPNIPIFQAPVPPSPGALVRKPCDTSVPRILELFAGYGGWKLAFQLFRPDDAVVSIEIDPSRALLFSRNFQVPMVDPQELFTHPTSDETVVAADALDTSWWLLSLAAPFTAIVYSAPCPPWSRGGTKPGFDSPEGVLLAHSFGFIHLFGVPIAIGENVDGLTDHPHWGRVIALLEATGLRYEVVVHDLADVGYMHRKRCFLLSGPTLAPPQWPRNHVSWQNVGALLSVIPFKATVELPPDPCSPFCQTRFLPSDKRMQAHNLGVQDGPAVVRLRTCEAMTLPTLVASYRFQDQLDLAHLLKKGIFTWLVPDQAFTFGARFMHAFEAARCLGFSLEFWLPADQSFAMHMLGNAVSPVQALWALAHVFSSTRDPLELARALLYDQLPLSSMRVVRCHDLMFLVQDLPLGRPHFLGQALGCVTCDGVLFPVPLPLIHSHVRVTCALPLASPWTLQEVGRWLQEDTLIVLARVSPLQVHLRGITIPLSPFATLDCLSPLLVAHVPHPKEDIPIWTWFSSDRPVLDYSDQALASPEKVVLTAGTTVRSVSHHSGETLEQHVQRAFPYCRSEVALASLPDGTLCAPSVEPTPGQAWQCQFYPQRIWIEPYGQFSLDPVSRVGEVANMLSLQYFAGRASVRLTCNGRLIPPEVSICSANQHGVLRARVFALPGGAPSLAAQMEALQTLLVQHGHPASSSKAKSDEVYNKLGQKKIRLIAESKTPWVQLKAEASAADIVLILWTLFRSMTLGKMSRSMTGSNKPIPQIEMPQLLQGVSGIVVADLPSFKNHLGSELTANLTVGASAVLLMGVAPSDVASGSSARVQALAVPGWLGNCPSSFRATLVQTGDEAVEFKALKELTLPEARTSHCVVQFHIYRDEAEQWDMLASQGVVAFLKHIGFLHFGSISQTWSAEYYSRGKKVPSAQASYYHGFLKLESARLDTLLKLGGISGFYPSPRSEARGPDPRYRNLLLRGLTLSEARAALAKTPTNFGLTRGKHGFGIRVLVTDYPEARKVHFPNGADSSDSEPGGPRKFQLLGVDDGVTRSLLKQALATMGWPARVSRAAGYKAWSVFAASDPPTRSFPLKQATVMIVEAVPSVKTGPAASRVTTLEKKFEALAETVTTSQQATAKNVEDLTRTVAQVNQQLDDQSRTFQTQLKSMFTKLADTQQAGFAALEKASHNALESSLQGLRKENSEAMKAMRAEFETGYQELKDILANSPKARKVDGNTPAAP
eukprot:Skav217432  [mRNA]  locus=scaffold1729:255000:261242:+ [translate_table: standard]